MASKEYRFQVVYHDLPDNVREEVINLWVTERILPQPEAERRVDELVLVIRNEEGDAIGVVTTYIRDFLKPGNYYYFLRMFIKPAERKSYSLLIDAYRRTFTVLDEYQQVELNPHGLLLEMENMKFSGKRIVKKLSENGLVYWGRNALGNDVWYHRFDAGLPEK